MAHWKQKTHLLRPDEFICSSCGASYEKAYKDCPSCGAHMRNTRFDPSWVDETEELSAIINDDW